MKSSSDSTTSSGQMYDLTAKVILSYRRDFCQSLTAQSEDVPTSPFSNGTLYVLNGRPSLSDVEHFNISRSTSSGSAGDQTSWNYYLNAGSNVSVNACLSDQSSDTGKITYYLIRGSRNFENWKTNPYDYFVHFKTLYSTCTQIAYSVLDGDMFYFVLYRAAASSSVNFNIDFQRRVYHISPDAVTQKCSFPLDGQSRCSVGVPFSSRYAILLSLNTTLPVDRDTQATITVSCQTRGWFYAMIVLCSVLPVLTCIICTIVCCCIRVRRRRNQYAALNAQSAAAGNVIINRTANLAPGANPPQQYNPGPVYHSFYEGYRATSASIPPSLYSYRR